MELFDFVLWFVLTSLAVFFIKQGIQSDFSLFHLLAFSFFPVLLAFFLYRIVVHPEEGSRFLSFDEYMDFPTASSYFIVSLSIMIAFCLIFNAKATFYKLKLYSKVGVYWLLGSKGHEKYSVKINQFCY